MLTYIIGKAYVKKKKFIFSTKHKKKLSEADRQKNLLFSRGGKKKFASNKNSTPPPPRYLMVRPLDIVKVHVLKIQKSVGLQH